MRCTGSDTGAVTSYLGLVPREASSGERQRKGAIYESWAESDVVLLIQSPWHVWRSPADSGPVHAWARRLGERRGRRIAVVALARRLARIVWAMWRDGRDSEPARVGRLAVAA